MFGWFKGKKASGSALKVPDEKTYVLFVCTANLSRSPMAEAMFHKEVEDRDDYVVDSAGTKSVPGFSPTPEALTVLQMRHYNTSDLHTERISEAMVRRADYLFVMGDVHLKNILHKFPTASEKTYLLSDFSEDSAKRGLDIPDPHEQPLTAYLEVFALLEHLIPRVVDFIEKGPTEEWQDWFDFYRRSDNALGR